MQLQEFWNLCLHPQLPGIGSICDVQVRGKGLLNAIVIKEQGGVNAYDVCMKLKDSGLLVSNLQKLLLPWRVIPSIPNEQNVLHNIRQSCI